MQSAGRAGDKVCRMHGAGGRVPRGNSNAEKHGAMVAEFACA